MAAKRSAKQDHHPAPATVGLLRRTTGDTDSWQDGAAFDRTEDRTMKTFRIIGSAIALAALTTLATFTPTAALADGPQAVSTAAQHAGIAAGSADLAGVHRHLHHVLNCLVGPDGQGFDAAPGNPCAAAGGAIPQTTDAAMKAKLEKVAAEVRTALASDDLDAAKKTASDVQAMLK
jgi:hypothetical protein